MARQHSSRGRLAYRGLLSESAGELGVYDRAVSAPEDESLRSAYEALARRIVEERLAFADRMQETTDEAQRALADRDRQIAQLTHDLETEVGTLHAQLEAAHADLTRIRTSRLYRLSAPIRRLMGSGD